MKKKIESHYFTDSNNDSDEEAPKAVNAEDFEEDNSSIRTFTTACLDAPRVCVRIVFLHRIGS